MIELFPALQSKFTPQGILARGSTSTRSRDYFLRVRPKIDEMVKLIRSFEGVLVVGKSISVSRDYLDDWCTRAIDVTFDFDDLCQRRY
jgi:hypothetical protein